MHLKASDLLPFLPWMRGYGPRYLKADLAAGFTVAVVAVPQSMAYALIAGLPVEYGLFGSIAPAIVASLWGSSAHLSTGPTTAISLVVFSVLSAIATPETPLYLELAFALALMVGALQMIMGVARLGALLNFVSHSVVLGFTAGAAVLIGFSQLPDLLGVKIEKSGVFIDSMLQVAAGLHRLHPPTFLLGALTIALILLFKKIRPALPGTLLAMVIAGGIVAAGGLDAQGVAVVGAFPATLPPFHLPAPPPGALLGSLATGALAIALLGLVEAVSIAKSIANQTHQRLDINQEFIGQGLSNISAGLFSSYAVSGSFARSAVNFRSGAKTPMSGVISGITVAATVLAAAPLAAKLPMTALAGVLMVVAMNMIHFKDIKRAMAATRADAAVLIITFLSTLLLNIEFAIYVGVLLSIGLHLAKTSHPRIQSVLPDADFDKMVPVTGLDRWCCQMDIIHIEGSIFFGSAAFVQEELQRHLRRHPPVQNLLLRMHRVNVLDASGVYTLELMLDLVRERAGGLYFAGLNSRVFEVFQNSGMLVDVGAIHIRATTGSAIRQAMRESFCPAICAACDQSVFKECPSLKKGDWEIFGHGVRPRLCRLPNAYE